MNEKKLIKEIDRWLVSATKFMAEHQREGNSTEYQHGYIQALNEVKEELKKK